MSIKRGNLKSALENLKGSRYNRKSVQNINKSGINVALYLCFLYNRQCWSLTAMMRKVADTPGRFAMASVWEIFAENVYSKIGEKEGK
ncbi:hypothetical protein CVD19_11870 [Bacillus sp. T33-2]|nr:hypothetical protein CVD19_11870 [Bacillus sp. T33-2]